MPASNLLTAIFSKPPPKVKGRFRPRLIQLYGWYSKSYAALNGGWIYLDKAGARVAITHTSNSPTEKWQGYIDMQFIGEIQRPPIETKTKEEMQAMTILSTPMKATLIKYPKKAHKWKELGVVILHDPTARVSLNEFDFRYKGNKSRLGRFLRDLEAQGVDVSDAKIKDTKPEDQELIIKMAQRLYEALVKRTVFKKSTNSTIITKEEKFDWQNKSVKYSKYYKMAEKILTENDQETAIRIINMITGYA